MPGQQETAGGLHFYLPFLKAHQQTACLRIVAAKASANMHIDRSPGMGIPDPFCQFLRGRSVLAMGNPHFALRQSGHLQMLQNRGQRLFLTTAFVERFQRALVTGLAHDPDTRSSVPFHASVGHSF